MASRFPSSHPFIDGIFHEIYDIYMIIYIYDYIYI